MNIATQAQLMEELAQDVIKCQACGLRAGCKNVVFGEGNPTAKLMVIGEGPGGDEDIQARPFVGKAGQLLDRMLQAAGFQRFVHAYIANIVKCRPPGNRIPTPDEREACLPHLRNQFRILHPLIVVLLGSTALQAIVDPNARITKARGQWVEKNGVWFMPTYHPAAVLRDSSLKVQVWKDFQLVIDRYRDLIDPQHQCANYPKRLADREA